MSRPSLVLVFLLLGGAACSSSESGKDPAAAEPTTQAPTTPQAPPPSAPAGMEIEVLKEGTGGSPKATDVVRVHYHGTFPDGKVFDSSVQRGEPAAFPLNRVIPCWTQAVQTMKVGGKIRVTCPPHLAYGANGAGPIPPNATLVFEVELLGIE